MANPAEPKSDDHLSREEIILRDQIAKNRLSRKSYSDTMDEPIRNWSAPFRRDELNS